MNEIEAIELLEKIEWQTRLAHCHSVDSSGGRSQCHICWNEKYQGHRENCKLFQALALLREKPEPTAFTKECRALRLKGATEEQWEYADKLGQACIYIDQLQAKLDERKG